MVWWSTVETHATTMLIPPAVTFSWDKVSWASSMFIFLQNQCTVWKLRNFAHANSLQRKLREIDCKVIILWIDLTKVISSRDCEFFVFPHLWLCTELKMMNFSIWFDMKFNPFTSKKTWFNSHFSQTQPIKYLGYTNLFNFSSRVKIMLPWDPSGKMGPKKPLPDHVSIVEPKEEHIPANPYSESKGGKAEVPM